LLAEGTPTDEDIRGQNLSTRSTVRVPPVLQVSENQGSKTRGACRHPRGVFPGRVVQESVPSSCITSAVQCKILGQTTREGWRCWSWNSVTRGCRPVSRTWSGRSSPC